jgi:1,4-alpha-glucan branching enzyme
MQDNYNHENAWSIGLPLMPVSFKFTDATAALVSVAGTFNDWHPTTKLMYSAGAGQWLKEAFLPPGNYEYCLVVDGQWMPDPLAKGHVSNPFGGKNSLLKVAKEPEAAGQ